MKSLRSFHILMAFTSLLTVFLSWGNSHDWWLPANYEVLIHGSDLLPALVCLGIWWSAPTIIRSIAKSDGKPCWGYEAIADKTVGIIVSVENYAEGVWLILWQPQRVDVQYLDCIADGDKQLFYCEHDKNALTPKPGDRMIAFIGSSGMTLEPHPRHRPVAVRVGGYGSEASVTTS